MTVSTDDRISNPVPVEIKNWAPAIKPPYVKNTTVRTYIVDPAGAANNKNLSIAGFEPSRLRMALVVIDAAVAITTDQPSTSPDTSSTAAANIGGYLPPNINGTPYEFFGPDTFWLNSLTTITRVTVIKEYC